MARSTMVDLLTVLREYIGDPAGASEVWTDDQLQRALDRRATDVRYAELEPVQTIQPGGAVAYLAYAADRGFWEKSTVTQLVDNTFAVLTPSASDDLEGKWTFSAHQESPVWLVGRRYDVCAAAADVLEQWAAKVGGSSAVSAQSATAGTREVIQEGDVRWAASGGTGGTSTTARAALLEMAAQYRARQEPRTGKLVRSDA